MIVKLCARLLLWFQNVYCSCGFFATYYVCIFILTYVAADAKEPIVSQHQPEVKSMVHLWVSA